ncbi:MAG TPA: hypothetical protein VF796_31005 [Humisphaera sp.]
MYRPVQSFLVAVTALAALAAGVLNGRVLCMAGEGHVAVEDPHAAAGHSGCCRGHGHDHDVGGHAAAADDGDGHAPQLAGGGSHGGCVDVHPDGTLVRQAARPAFQHDHPPVAVFLVASVAPADCVGLPAGGRFARLRSDCGPPDPGVLASLRTIVLTI